MELSRKEVTAAKVALRAEITGLIGQIKSVAADPKVPDRLLSGGFIQDVQEFFRGLDKAVAGFHGKTLQSGSLAELAARKARLEKLVRAIT